MRRLLASLVLTLCAFVAHSQSVVGSSPVHAGNTTTLSVTMPSSIPIGDLLDCYMFAGYTSPQTAPTISDSVNAGSYTYVANADIYQQYNYHGLEFVLREDTVGTPVVTISNLGGFYWTLMCTQITGFSTAHPVLVTADVAPYSSLTGTTITAGPLTNTAAPEFLVVHIAATGATSGLITPTTSSFTDTPGLAGHGGYYGGYVLESTTGHSLSLTAPQNSGPWIASITGFKDAGGAAPTSFSRQFLLE